MANPARAALSLIATTLLCAAAFAQQVPTPEEAVLVMLREWRASRAARADNLVQTSLVEEPKAAVPVKGRAPGSITRIRVGGRVQQALLISGSQPSYPEEARTKGIEGLVALEALIGADGTIQALSVISGDLLLVPTAIESVKQWTYRPTLLNGIPVEVLTQIEINFPSAR